jgi:hypothetical protein
MNKQEFAYVIQTHLIDKFIPQSATTSGHLVRVSGLSYDMQCRSLLGAKVLAKSFNDAGHNAEILNYRNNNHEEEERGSFEISEQAYNYLLPALKNATNRHKRLTAH